jgi:hypothetical protein
MRVSDVMAPGWQSERSRPSDSSAIAAAGWRSGCPVCGYHDKVRQLDAVYHDRERRHAEQPPLVNRFGLMVRGHPLLSNIPRAAHRLSPPRRPSALATYARSGWLHAVAIVGIPATVAALVRPDTSLRFLLSLAVMALFGVVSRPLSERGGKVWDARRSEWEQAMRAWRELRYCSRCDQVFASR